MLKLVFSSLTIGEFFLGENSMGHLVPTLQGSADSPDLDDVYSNTYDHSAVLTFLLMFVETELKGVRVFTFSEFSQIPHFIFAVSSRQTDSALGLASVTSDRLKKSRLCDLLGILPDRLMTLRQIHSSRSVVADSRMRAERIGDLGPADGIIVTEPGLFAAIRTADCLPVVGVIPKTSQFLLVHMGWRGAQQEILQKSLEKFFLVTAAGSEEAVVGLGPCIRSCCYQVGVEVEQAFQRAGYSFEEVFCGDRLDLIAVARHQLARCGVKDVLDSGICTACRTDLFYSYRREATDSRMWTLAGFRR